MDNNRPPLSLRELTSLSMLVSTVQAGEPITYLNEEGTMHWGISRAFTHEGGGFLSSTDDVRDAFVWLSGGTHFGEAWLPVSMLIKGMDEGRVSLGYRPQ